MKIKSFFVFSVLIISFIYYSCEDTGISPGAYRKGAISFSLKNVKHLDPDVEGVYQLWIAFDTSAGLYYRRAGSFNIDGNGGITYLDSIGRLELYEDSVNTRFAQYCFVTITLGANDSDWWNKPRLIGGSFSLYSTDSIAVGPGLQMSDTSAFGPAISPVINGDTARYMLYEPTGNNLRCSRGAWFCDTLGNPLLPAGMQLNPATSKWVYEGWVVDTTNPNSPIYYSMGRFYDPYSADLDGAGPCRGSGIAFNKPGQDWVLEGGSCPPTDFYLNNGYMSIFITIEPANETGPAFNNPFPYKLYLRSGIVGPPFPLICGSRRLDRSFRNQFCDPNSPPYGNPRGYISIHL